MLHSTETLQYLRRTHKPLLCFRSSQRETLCAFFPQTNKALVKNKLKKDERKTKVLSYTSIRKIVLLTIQLLLKTIEIIFSLAYQLINSLFRHNNPFFKWNKSPSSFFTLMEPLSVALIREHSMTTSDLYRAFCLTKQEFSQGEQQGNKEYWDRSNSGPLPLGDKLLLFFHPTQHYCLTEFVRRSGDI